MTLVDFLKGRFRRRGPWNCSTMAADWCIALGYPDFASAWRHVADPAECDCVAAAGLVALWNRGIGDALPVIEAPYRPGDIGVIRHLGLEAGSVFTGERWALDLERGMVFVPLSPNAILKAWRP